MSLDGLAKHRTLADLERSKKTSQKIRVVHGVQKVLRFCRRITNTPEPHDRFTPYEQLTPEERQMRIRRIRKEHHR